jgi:serine/threonine protein phosphatase PrpC
MVQALREVKAGSRSNALDLASPNSSLAAAWWSSSTRDPPACPPARPLGLQEDKPACCETRLEPGDRLLLYTDGITEARSPDGEFFGEQRLADFVGAAVAAGEPSPEMVRRLMRHILDHQADQLQDDASIVALEWLTGAPRRVLP